jgi:hypothetical protein
MPVENATFVLFVDMLGFAALVEAEGDDLSELNPIFKDIDRHGTSAPAANLLQYRFVNFHRCVEKARLMVQDARSGTVIVFSDSAFFQVSVLDYALELARTMMRDLVENAVPARIGIANGSFMFLRSMTDTSSQVSFHMSQFVGSGIVRAYAAAERSKIPGLRIFLHQSLSEHLDESMQTLEVASPPDADAQITRELNYLDPKSHMQFPGPDYADVIVFDNLRHMWGEADEKFHYHYQATFDALNRMRAQFGRESYDFDKMLDRDKFDKEHDIHPPDYRAEDWK